MRLLFAHDHRFLSGEGGALYTSGSFPAAVWDRYLRHFESVTVIARNSGKVPDPPRLARTDRDRVSFAFLPSLASSRHLLLRPREIDEQMMKAVNSVDAVVARLPSEIGMLAVKHARRLGKPYGVEVVGSAWDSYANSDWLARAYAPLVHLRARRAIAAAPLALYVTSSWLQGRYPTSGQWWSASNVYLQPVHAEAVAKREERLRELARGKLPVLGTIGVVRVKGIRTALEALAQLRSSGIDLQYRLLGSGPVEHWQEVARQLGIADLVHFDGTRVAGEGVCSWLDEIDIYLQPSFTEGIPRGMIEAMSRGCACVGSDCGGIPEILAPERRHRPGDSSALAQIVCELATNPRSVATASEVGRETARLFDPMTLQACRDSFYARLRANAEQAGQHRRASDSSRSRTTANLVK